MPVNGKRKKKLLWLFLIIALLAVFFIRLRLLDIPLERDEGDYAINAALLLDGHSLSSPLIMKRFPFIYYIYMLFITLFGHSDAGIHFGLLLANLASAFGIYLLGRRLRDRNSGILAAAFFLLMSLSPDINGLAANREHFQVLFVVFGAFFLLQAEERKRYLNYALAGLMMGLSFAVKQNALFFMAWGGLWILAGGYLFQRKKWQAVWTAACIYSFAALLPFFIILLIYTYSGVFDAFLTKTFYSNSRYLTKLGFSEGMLYFFNHFSPFFYSYTFLFLFAFLPVFIWKKEKEGYRVKTFLLSFAIFSFMSIVPGGHFYPHYFILIVPAIALAAAAGVLELRKLSEARRTRLHGVLVFLPMLIMLQPLLAESFYFFRADATQASRVTYEYNPFPEAKTIGRYIKRITKDTSSIMVLGSEPELYFYAERRPAISAYYMYFMMDGSELARQKQEELIRQAEKEMPEVIVYVGISSSWMSTPESDEHLINWFNLFLENNRYQLVGAVDIFQDRTHYIYGPEARKYKIRSNGFLTLFQRAGRK